MSICKALKRFTSDFGRKNIDEIGDSQKTTLGTLKLAVSGWVRGLKRENIIKISIERGRTPCGHFDN